MPQKEMKMDTENMYETCVRYVVQIRGWAKVKAKLKAKLKAKAK